MNETCPSCAGPRVPDDPSVLNVYAHEPSCALLLAERETLQADRRRFLRHGAAVRHRAASDAERALVAASGVRVGPREPMHVRVDWPAPDLRMRMFTRAGLVAADEVPPPSSRGATTLGDVPTILLSARTGREAKRARHGLNRSDPLEADMTMRDSDSPAPPTGTRAGGRRLWASVAGQFDLDEHETAILVEACRTVDALDALDARVRVQGVIVTSPQGDRANPALVEARQQRITLARLLAALRVPQGAEGDEQASARPQRRGGARGVYAVPRLVGS